MIMEMQRNELLLTSMQLKNWDLLAVSDGKYHLLKIEEDACLRTPRTK